MGQLNVFENDTLNRTTLSNNQKLKALNTELSKVNAEISELQNQIKDREMQFKAEQQERENDPLWRVAALDYIRNGDRSGLENYNTNRIMAENNLIEKINGYQTEKLELIKNVEITQNRIKAIKNSLNNGDLSVEERQSLEQSLYEQEENLKQYKELQKVNEAKRNQSVSFYEKKYRRKFQDENRTPVNLQMEGSPEKGKVSENESVIEKKNELMSDAVDFATGRIGVKNYTIEQYNEKVRELKNKAKEYGLKGKDIEDIIAKLGDKPSQTRLNDFRISSGWNDAMSGLKKTPTQKFMDVDNALKEIMGSESYLNLDPYEKDELRKEIEDRYNETEEGKIKVALSGDKTAQIQDWAKNKTQYLNLVKTAMNVNATEEETQKAHSEAYSKISSNPYALSQIEKQGFKYNPITGRFERKVKQSGEKPNGKKRNRR